MAHPIARAVSSPATPSPSMDDETDGLPELLVPDKKPVWAHQRSISLGPNRLRMLRENPLVFSPETSDDVQIMKKKDELVQYMKENENDIREEYSDRIQSLESSIALISEENESYESQVISLKQHNNHLREVSNQSQNRYNEAKSSLLNANEEITNLKKELKDLQIVYQHDITQIQSSTTMVLQQTVNEDDVKQRLQQYIQENTFLKKENLKLLNELKEMNHQCRDTATKYDEMNRMHMDLQRELSAAYSRIAELEKQGELQERDIRYLENLNEELKQNLHTWPDSISNSEMNVVHMDADHLRFTPSLKGTPNPGGKFRRRSMSQNSVLESDSMCNSPITIHRKSCFGTGAWIGWTDLFMDGLQDNAMEEEAHKTIEDLYERMEHYLLEMEECVHAMRDVETPLRALNKHRGSISNIMLDANQEAKNKEEDENDGHRKNIKLNRRDSRLLQLRDESETLMKVWNKEEEQTRLMQMKDIVAQCKDCISEMHKQQTCMILSEHRKYQDLDKAFKRYQMDTMRKMKQLTVDMYRTHYKKYSGYKDICCEMVGNVGTYTKDAIVYRLTH